jgi:hypothetical protein
LKLLEKIYYQLFGAKKYEIHLRLLTKNEVRLFCALQYFFKGCFVLPKVCLRSIFDAKCGDFEKTAKIKQKHVDFTVVDRDLNILFCFELDDSSHNYAGRIGRDRLVDYVFDDAGVPLVRVPSLRQYDEYTIQSAISQTPIPSAQNKDYSAKALLTKKEKAAFLLLSKKLEPGQVLCSKTSLREFFAPINSEDDEAFYYLSKRLASFAVYDYHQEQLDKIILLKKSDKNISADLFFKKLCKISSINYEIM